MAALLCFINLSQSLQQGAHYRVMRRVMWPAFNSPPPPISTRLQSGMTGWIVFENPWLSTITKNKACSFLTWSVEVWSHVEYFRVLLVSLETSHTKTLVIVLRNTPLGIHTNAKNYIFTPQQSSKRLYKTSLTDLLVPHMQCHLNGSCSSY